MPSRRSVKIVRRTLADGSVKTYRYQTAGPPDDAGPTFSTLLTAYRQSVEWRALSPSSRRVYDRAFGHVASLRNLPIGAIGRGDVLAIRDRLADAPGTCNAVLTALSVLYGWAISREWTERNPAARVKKMPTTPYRRWTWDQIAFASQTFPVHVVRAMCLGLFTGQRMGDVLGMRWNDIDGSGVQVAQQKTGAKLWIPLHSELARMLKACPRDAVTILVSPSGLPWTVATFAPVFSTLCRKHPETDGLVYHGLRKTAASVLAELGCTPHEIASITGHRTLAMVAHYSAGAEQRRLAEAAMEKWENGPAKSLKLRDAW